MFLKETNFLGVFTKTSGLIGPFLQKASTQADHIWDLLANKYTYVFMKSFRNSKRAILSYYVKVFRTTDLFLNLLNWLIFIEYVFYILNHGEAVWPRQMLCILFLGRRNIIA